MALCSLYLELKQESDVKSRKKGNFGLSVPPAALHPANDMIKRVLEPCCCIDIRLGFRSLITYLFKITKATASPCTSICEGRLSTFGSSRLRISETTVEIVVVSRKSSLPFFNAIRFSRQ